MSHFKGVVRVDDHLLYLMEQQGFDLDDVNWPFDSSSPYFTVYSKGVVVIVTGISYGPVDVEVDVLSSAPPLNIEGWEDVTEGDLRTDNGELMVAGLDFVNVLPGDDRCLTKPGSAFHRVRVHATGREILHDAALFEDPVEKYLIQIWPTTIEQSEVVHKYTSRH